LKYFKKLKKIVGAEIAVVAKNILDFVL